MAAVAARDRRGLLEFQKRREGIGTPEAFPYGKELASVMVSPVYTVSPEEDVRNAVREMSRRGVSSAVAIDPEGRPVGILTERDVLRKVATDDRLDGLPVSALMTPAPIVLSPSDTIYRALSVLSKSGIKHMPLVEGGRLAGIVTLRQLMRLRHPEPMVLITRIEEASGPEDLRRVKAELPALAASRLVAGVDATDIAAMLSLINQDMHRKALELVMERSGPPPASICLFVTGSHGRLENSLTSDQDHGMIIADTPGGLQYDPWFMENSALFSEWLGLAGFPLCPGYVMSVNPTWRKSLSEWQMQLDGWFAGDSPALVRYLTLIFDAIPVYGDFGLFHGMKEHAFSLLAKSLGVLRVLYEEEKRHKAPLGLLGRFITEAGGPHKGELSLKRSGIIFIVEGVRILALMHGIRETSTTKRIRALVEAGFMHPDDGDYFGSAYEALLFFMLKAQSEKALDGRKVDSYIRPGRMSAKNRQTLRNAFRAVAALQDHLAAEFGQLVI